MKQYYFFSLLIVSSFIIFIAEGCGLANSSYFTKDYEENQEYTSNLGDIMISEEKGLKNDVYGWVVQGFVWELIYSGVSNNQLKLRYREYNKDRSDAYIKEGFTQDLQFDLNIGDTIAYKDIRIKIIEANNVSIKFLVIGTNKTKAIGREQIGPGVLPETRNYNDEKPDSNQVIHYIKFPLDKNKKIESKPAESDTTK